MRELPETVSDGGVGEGALGKQSKHVLKFHILLLKNKRDEMIADESIPWIGAMHESLPIELPQIGLAVLHLYHIILK